MASFLQSGPLNKRLWLLFVVALAINVGFLYLYYEPSPKRLVGDENYYYTLGVSIATGQDVRQNPLWPPLYGKWVGVLFSIFGAKIIVVQIAQIGLWLVSAFLFYRITVKAVASVWVAQICLGLFLLSPELIAFTHYLWPEIVHLFWGLLGLWFLICYRDRWFSAAASGACLGLALLTKSLLLPFLPVATAMALVAIARQDQLRLRGSLLRIPLLFSFAVLLTILPTMLTNLRVQHTLTIADSSIFNIWVGLNDVGTADYRNVIVDRELAEFERAGPDLAAKNAVYEAKLWAKISEQGLANAIVQQVRKQYFRLFDYKTFFVTQLPGGARQAYHFGSRTLSMFLMVFSAALYSFVLIAGAAGTAFIPLRPLGWIHVLAAFVIYNLALFLLLHVKTRYVIQFLPALILFAGMTIYGLSTAWRRQGSSVTQFVFSRRRTVISVVLGLLMTILVFHNLLLDILNASH